MTLYLTAIDPLANERRFNCQLSSLEAKFDFLSAIVSQGHTLLTAYILDDLNRIDLPIDAFDGLPMSADIQTLEKEWTSRLSTPRLFSLAGQSEFVELTHRLIRQIEANIMTHQHMIDRYNQWLKLTQSKAVSTDRRSRLIHLYQTQLASHQAHVAKARFRSLQLANRLNKLESELW